MPQELSIIGFGDTRRQTIFQKRLVSVAINEFEIGVKAAESLGQMCSGSRPIDNNESFMMDLEIIGEDTLGPAPQ